MFIKHVEHLVKVFSDGLSNSVMPSGITVLQAQWEIENVAKKEKAIKAYVVRATKPPVVLNYTMR